ncbi:hemolysin family protein [Pseudoruegeria sp. SHC-113]|uniref:hemolysin family protein n=1 Tax=Pseudoruegeria sp. SHC-113 TaxID=2855439 RepID=UPI0021BB23E0|nr:hemolysin family protein [Pseudoruegeria sp. SHC-113]MCT8161841.1 hemolysin family protein [Pseudoruegeria sp. SHC-113]
MGDTTDGSSNAAHGAQETDTSSDRGFFGRIMDALASPEANGTEAEGAASNPSQPVAGMVNLRRMRVEDVAIPTADITAVAADIGLPELIEVFRESGFTRLPVFENTLDTPIGFVNLKDLALKHGFNGGGGDLDLRAIVRQLLYVPPSMPIGVLLQKMQTERIHMALVIDEYGGVDGLVTIEDLIEQVIGEIEDEHDTDEDKLWIEEKPGQYLVEAKTPLEEFEAEISQSLTDSLDDEEIDTLGGLVFVLTGRIPARGEVVEHPDGPEFEVVDADPRRIKRLRVHVPGAEGA